MEKVADGDRPTRSGAFRRRCTRRELATATGIGVSSRGMEEKEVEEEWEKEKLEKVTVHRRRVRRRCGEASRKKSDSLRCDNEFIG